MGVFKPGPSSGLTRGGKKPSKGGSGVVGGIAGWGGELDFTAWVCTHVAKGEIEVGANVVSTLGFKKKGNKRGGSKKGPTNCLKARGGLWRTKKVLRGLPRAQKERIPLLQPQRKQRKKGREANGKYKGEKD